MFPIIFRVMNTDVKIVANFVKKRKETTWLSTRVHCWSARSSSQFLYCETHEGKYRKR